MEFHEFAPATVLAGPEELSIPRARDLFDAISRNRDYRIVQLSRVSTPEGEEECLTVEVECHGVPRRNPHGLLYRERLLLRVSPDRKQLVSVYAMRKDFPQLIHQQQVGPDSPAHLCLYFEPPSSVHRTWTAQAFLRRIQWWFEKSARGELHPADQPVEQLFFASKFELVLPWNFPSLDRSQEFEIVRTARRQDGGTTYSLVPKNVQTGATVHPAILIQVVLPTIVHSPTSLHPDNLGQLADMLAEHQVNLLPLLKEKLSSLVDHSGAELRADKPHTIIHLHVPICRELGGPVERWTDRAFLIDADPLNLGLDAGALIEHEGRHYNSIGVIDPEPATKWRAYTIKPMEMLLGISPEKARAHSGVKEPGPTAVMVGAGSLGSALLNLWGRSGWGQWSVIDADHIKPHNLVRHTALAQHIGLPKVDVVASLHQAVFKDAGKIAPHFADACDEEGSHAYGVLMSGALVVDASASLEYPRHASKLDSYPRHASVFVTPSANACVALIEDSQRRVRLRTLEAQYYRAISRSDWGADHLTGNLGTYWSGASCRDISMVMPYASIMLHASTIAEQLPRLLETAEPTIRVWQKNANGAVEAFEVPVHQEKRRSFGDLDVFIDEGLEQSLRQMRKEQLPNETGGILLGYQDFNIDALVLVDALPAPADSVSSPTSFERGIEDLKAKVEEASKRTAGIVGYVGEWHSHPPGHSAKPSNDDLVQLLHLALGMSEDGLPGLQLIVGEDEIRLMKAS